MFSKKWNLIILSILLTITVALRLLLNYSNTFWHWYVGSIYLFFQKGRSLLFNHLPFSIGDILYLVVLILLLTMIGTLVYFIITFKKNKHKIFIAFLQTTNICLVIYFAFLLFWGGNYNRAKLTADWATIQIKNNWDSTKLVNLNLFLVKKLNELTRNSLPNISDKFINKQSNLLYQTEVGDRYNYFEIKPSLLGNMLNYFGIQGYYNPLSGEGQFNNHLPAFMHPFVMSHEMAHQAGIAAEDDANLMAYVICTKSDNATFQYSGYFNILLYAFSELKHRFPNEAAFIQKTFNERIVNDISLLRHLRQQYKSELSVASLGLYNKYLVWLGQENGIKSYGTVSRWVYLWENGEKEKADGKVCLNSY